MNNLTRILRRADGTFDLYFAPFSTPSATFYLAELLELKQQIETIIIQDIVAQIDRSIPK